MAQFRHTNGDVANVSPALVEYMAAQPGWSREYTDEEAAELKGAELERALTESGLPKSGTADEKRERLADKNKEN